MNRDRLVALVTGASRGVGRGVAEHLASTGVTVYVTGRSVRDAGLPEQCVPVTCDHTDDSQVTAVFAAGVRAHYLNDIDGSRPTPLTLAQV